jgi:hypothetical protein
MSGKSGQRETGNKPTDTRRHDSQTPGAFGHESVDNVKAGVELNRKVVGKPSEEHAKHRDKDAADEKASGA